MIHMISGHLGSGDWKLKTQDGVQFLHHRLPFSPRSEYRLGCDQIVDVQVVEINAEQRVINMTLTEERHCTAQVSADELEHLMNMISSNEPAPEPQSSTSLWVYTVIGVLLLSFVLQFLEHSL